MADNYAVAAVLNGIAGGFVKGMQLRQQRESSLAEQDLAKQKMQVDINNTEEMRKFREMQLGAQTEQNKSLNEIKVSAANDKFKMDLADKMIKAAELEGKLAEAKDKAERADTKMQLDANNAEIKALTAQLGILSKADTAVKLQGMKGDQAIATKQTAPGVSAKNLTPEEKALMNAKTNALKNKTSMVGKNGTATGKPSMVDMAVQRLLAKDISDFTINREGAIKGINALENARDRLEVQKPNRVLGEILPDKARSILTRESMNIQQAIQKNVYPAMRATFGPQFTEKEGERLLKVTYDPGANYEENLYRLNNLISQVKGAFDAKEEMTKYYQQNKSLDGYKGYVPNMSDVNPSIKSTVGRQQSAAPASSMSTINFKGKMMSIPSSRLQEALKDGAIEVK